MAHVRKQIRDRAAARLTGLPTTGAHVFIKRRRPVAENKLPAHLVYTTDERSEKSTDDSDEGMELERRVSLEIEMLAHEAEAEDTLDQMAVEVEQALAEDPTLGGILRELVLVATREVYDGSGARVAGSKRLTYDATYLTAAGDPETAL